MNQLILHADDAGLNESANLAISELLKKGLIQSTSLMAYGSAKDHFLKITKDNWDVGLHIALPHAQRRIYDQIAEEWDHLGIMPTHIDSHGGKIFQNLDWFLEYLSFAQDRQVPALLTKNDLNARFPQFLTKHLDNFGKLFDLPRIDDVHMLPATESLEQKISLLAGYLESMQDGITQIIIHPCLDQDTQGYWDYLAVIATAPLQAMLRVTTWRQIRNDYWSFLI